MLISQFCPILTGIASAAQNNAPGYGHPYGDHWDHMMPFGGIFFWIILVLVVIVLVSVLARRSGSGGERSGPGGETPMDILKKRYARGELNKEEFERMKRDIQ